MRGVRERPTNRTFGELWRNADFMRLWTAESISVLGSQVTLIAVPLTAVLSLGATPTQMGLLLATEEAPVFLLALLAGAWVDRLRRRLILIVSDLARAAALLSIPVATWLHVLRIEQLYVVGFVTGALTVLFDAAYVSFLPSLLRKEQLIEGNSKLEVSQSIVQISGPGLGGAAVQVLSAPIAILCDSFSFVGSALFLLRIKSEKPLTAEHTVRRGILKEIGDGLRTVLGNPVLRALAASSGTFNFFDNLLFAVYVLYMVRMLHLPAYAIGLVFGLGGIGALAASVLASKVPTRFGTRRTIIGGLVVAAVGELSIAGAQGPVIVAFAVLAASEALVEIGAVTFRINQVSLMQALTPDHLRGRVSASARFISRGMAPVGAVTGGVLGTLIGLRGTVVVAGLGTLLAFIWVALSPVGALQDADA